MNSNDAALAQLHGLAAPEEVHTVADTAVGTEWRAALNRAEGLRLLRELAWGENLLRDGERDNGREAKAYAERDEVDSSSWLAAASSWFLTGWASLDYSHSAADARKAEGERKGDTERDDERAWLLQREMAAGYRETSLFGTEVGGRHSVLARRRRYYDSLATTQAVLKAYHAAHGSRKPSQKLAQEGREEDDPHSPNPRRDGGDRPRVAVGRVPERSFGERLAAALALYWAEWLQWGPGAGRDGSSEQRWSWLGGDP